MWKYTDYCSGKEMIWYSEEDYNRINNKLKNLTAFIKTQCEIYKANQTEDRVCDNCKDSNCLLKDILEIVDGE